tara:strand:- start:420 stop:620 length:201 start_codon:yes stop_codon:yes gene_type:complete
MPIAGDDAKNASGPARAAHPARRGSDPNATTRGLEPRRIDAPRPARARAAIRDRALLFEVAPRETL